MSNFNPIVMRQFYALLCLLLFSGACSEDDTPTETWMPLLLGATVLLVGLMVTFTIMPPDFLLFHDASLVDAWVVYPY